MWGAKLRSHLAALLIGYEVVAGLLKMKRRKKLKEEKQCIITVGDSFSPQNSSPEGKLHDTFKHLLPRTCLIGKMPAESKRTLKLSSQRGVDGARGVNFTSNTGTR